jgi:hypothetical protein
MFAYYSAREAAVSGPQKRKPKPVLGWREWLSLPHLGIPRVKAKIDTGARSSALHAFDIEIFEADGKEMVRFKVHPFQRDLTTTVESVAELHDRRTVRSSAGHESIRPVILAEVQLDGQQWAIELTLTRRDAMGFRMLLGRQAIRRRFRVEPARSFLVSDRHPADNRPPAAHPAASKPNQKSDADLSSKSRTEARRKPKPSEPSTKGKPA